MLRLSGRAVLAKIVRARLTGIGRGGSEVIDSLVGGRLKLTTRRRDDMRLRRVVLLVFAGLTSGLAAAEQAADLFRKGETQLAAGDLQGALQQFAGAVRASPSNQQYMQQYAMLRQVLMMRASLPNERVAAQWEYKARGLSRQCQLAGLFPGTR
jgi:hypothetical protein